MPRASIPAAANRLIGLGSSGNGAVGLVWPGYVLGGLIEFVSMVSYLVAGPDGMAVTSGESPAKATVSEGLVQA